VLVGLAGAALLVATAPMPRPVYVRQQNPSGRRRRRFYWNLLTLISLVLCLASAALWVTLWLSVLVLGPRLLRLLVARQLSRA